MSDAGTGGGRTVPDETGDLADDEARTPDQDLHTGAESAVDPEDVVMAQGQDPTPENVERARRRLEEEGPSFVEKIVP